MHSKMLYKLPYTQRLSALLGRAKGQGHWESYGGNYVITHCHSVELLHADRACTDGACIHE